MKKIKRQIINKNRDRDIFGTDGIRGRVGQFPLDNDSLIRLGYSLKTVLFKDPDSKVLIGRDTRKSGQEIINRLIQNQKYTDCGIVTSPGLSYLTRKNDFQYGIMVTASHNPYLDNGIKIFNHRGEKVSASLEEEIQNHFFSQKKTVNPGKIKSNSINIDQYVEFLIEKGQDLKGEDLKLVVDCANGAASFIISRLLKELQIQHKIIFNKPDGQNINQNCGSESPQNLIDAVISRKASLGIGFDGDGDRVIFIDPAGQVIDGDYSLYLLAQHFLFNSYEKKGVVGTVVSNLGLEKALLDHNIKFFRAKVGDKNVYSKLKQEGLFLGAEPSGHIIHRKHQNTGDGILSALLFLQALKYLSLSPDKVVKGFKKTPQRLVNIPIKKKIPLNEWPELQDKIMIFNNKFGENSRILIRYSGTEAKIRVMLESFDETIINQNLPDFKIFIKNKIGV